MGRRNEHSRKQIKEMAIEAGKKIIVEEGFPNLGARKIARTIGYTVGTLYNVFDNYLDIVLHINTETLDNIKNHLEKSLVPGEEGVKAITTIGLTYVGYARENTNLWSALFDFKHPENTDMPEWYVEKVNSVFSLPVKALIPLFQGDIERAKNEARIIWGGVHGICLLGLSQRLSYDSDEILKTKVRSLIENYMRGLELKDEELKQTTGF
jgi:AcrR family transcriptional regulator